MAAAKGNDYAKKHTVKEIEKLSNDILDWAESAKDIHLAGWARKHKKTTPWTNWLANNYPIFKAAKDEALILLGRKILNASFYGSGNASVGMGYLPIYDKDYRALLKWKAEISKEQPRTVDSKGAFNSWKNEQKKS